jgi:hypothetical protein
MGGVDAPARPDLPPRRSQGPPGQRVTDPLFSIVWPTMTPAQVLNPTEAGLDWYRYDTLPT